MSVTGHECDRRTDRTAMITIRHNRIRMYRPGGSKRFILQTCHMITQENVPYINLLSSYLE